jgi:hypothetical protein
MTFYCKQHPDFEGLDLGKLHDHVERDHQDIFQGELMKNGGVKAVFAKFFTENVEVNDFRRSDGKMFVRTWGRPPKVGNWMGDNQKEKQ